MMGILTEEQARHLLQSQLVGRIGCYAGKEIYVVPVTYALRDGYIYAHSREGQKVRMMRKNTAVCLQVDAIENMSNWRSVIAWGEFQELVSERERNAGLKILRDRVTPFVTSETVRPHVVPAPPEVIEKERKAVVYRIHITKITGRFEKTGLPEITE
ncbi:pyridoxamine 5'-phosphate oxidase family protein [Dawidia soli]|uniref:Pyridoxamine 5'-phosphate oxidase family protein n=1 Tax=Dawidia soli TaxID=2782352 RepID=A0AAP2D7C8_9BACT|nr:pyridoxamine 5'-phosphate oxidase family protein [Dawidia soli]MBT1686477.1 pyridoxamine 5'-phosphate oxidase family protein [Dawidia soli]